MSSNEGSSSGTHLLRNRGASLDIEVMIGELGVELNRIENIVEVEESQAYPTPTLKCRPLSLFDNYQVIGGVPAFVFENQGDHQKQICTYSVSSDGSRLAVAMKDNSICVYNLLDSCSLVAKGESSSLNLDQDRYFEVYYISFWNARNDKLIVLSKDANIAFVSIKRELDTSNKCEDSESTYASVFVVTHPFIVDQTQLHCTILDVFVDGFTLWVASKDISHDDGFITINRITEERYMQVKIYDEAFKDITNCHVQLGGNIAMVTQCSYGTSLRGETTHFISVPDYRGNHTMTSPPINGRLIEWDLETNYILIVQMQNDQHMLYLYSLGAVKHKVSPPIASFELGKRLIDVKGVFLSRKAWPHCELEATSNAYSPLVCVVSIKSSASILSIWDTHLKKIIKQIDVSIDKMQITHRSTISFSMSQDRKWFALGCSSTKKVTLFSLSAEVMVWSVKLDLKECSSFSPILLQFDASASKLLMFSNDTLFVFVPPCLIKDMNLELKYASIRIDKNRRNGESFQKHHTKLMSQNIILNLLKNKEVDYWNVLSRVRVAIPYFSSEFALMFRSRGNFSIIFASMEDMFCSTIRNVVNESLKGYHINHTFRVQTIKDNQVGCLWYEKDLFHIFLYPNKERNNDHIVLFCLHKDQMAVRFLHLEEETPELVLFDQKEVLCCFQSKDGLRVICIKTYGVLIVDLEQREVTYEVKYQVNLPHWLHKFSGKKEYNFNSEYVKELPKDEDEINQRWVLLLSLLFSQPDIVNNGESILLGWSCDNNKSLFLTNETKDHELEELLSQEIKIWPCWAMDDCFDHFSYLECDKHFNSITSIGLYCKKNERCKHFKSSEWNFNIANILKDLNCQTLQTLQLKLDKNSGSLWITVLYTTMDIEQRLLVLPLGPYSMRDSLPYIDAFDDLPTNHRVDKLNKLACQFEASCFNMPFNGMTNLHRAIKYGDIDVINLVLNGAEKHNIQLGVTWYQDHIIEDKSNILETAISEKREDLVRAVLNLYEMQKMPFNIAAAIIKRCFEDIWQTNRLIFEAMLLDNLLLWDICSIDVPVKMLSKDEHLVHVGMLDDPLTWKQETSEEVKNCIWESLEVKCNRDDHHNAGDTKIKTEMKIFCMEDICKIGSRGIIRFLLTQRAPSYLFKTPLIKWTIFWKWEHLWKKDTVKSSIYFLCMLAIYTTYVICFGFYSKKLQDDLFIQVSLTLVLLLSLAMNTRLYFQEVKEIKTRIKDGQRFFPGRRFAGLMYYLSSSWNIWENVTYFVLLFGIVPLHFVTFYSTSHIFFLNSILAIEIICLWRKLWYYAQAFTMTSAFVLMIENVVRDCIPFLILSGIALVGFSLALFILFQHSLHYSVASGQENDSGDHVEGGISLHKINASYGTPQKSMLTLFYAMIGTFDVEIYSNSGTLAPFIIFIFVSYLSVQAIALFNTLLAIISDTFDKVKSTEEEQLLIGRARFIDAREASMSEGQIKKMDEKIGRYLYVVLPKDKELHTNQDLWKGRVRTIGRRVQKIVSNSQAIIMENTKNSMKDLEKSMQIDKGEIEEYVNSKISALKEAMNRDIKALKESMKRNLYFLSNVKNDAGELEESMKNDRIALEHVMKSEIKALEEVMRSFMENIKEDISILKNKIEQK